MKPYGYHWEVCAKPSNEVVSSGFYKAEYAYLYDSEQPNGFFQRTTPVYTRAALSQPAAAASDAPDSSVTTDNVAKDAAIREYIEESLTYVGSPSWSPSLEREGRKLLAAIAHAANPVGQ